MLKAPSQKLSPVFALAFSLTIFGCTEQPPKTSGVADPKPTATHQSSGTASTTDDPAARLAGASWVRDNGPKTLVQAKQQMIRSFILKPDRRFINALRFQHQILKGESIEPQCEFDGKKWRVHVGKELLATISQYPSFEELFGVLKKDAGNLKSTTDLKFTAAGAPAQSIDKTPIAPDQLLAQIDAADLQFASKNVKESALQSAARALSVLAIEQLDLMEIGDSLAEKALALISISEALTGKELAEEKCLLADRCGYFSEAKKLAARLPVESSVKSYCSKDSSKLATATKADANKLARILCLKSAAGDREMGTWKTFAASWFQSDEALTLPVLATFSQAAPEESLMPVAHHLMLGAEHQIDRAGTKVVHIDVNELKWTYNQYVETVEWMLNDTLGGFEQKLKSIAGRQPRLIDKNAVTTDFARSFFYSGIYMLTQTYESLPSGWEQIDKFRHSLGYEGAEAIPKAAVAWVKAKASTGAFMPGTSLPGARSEETVTDLRTLKALGAPPLLDLYQTLVISSSAPDQSIQFNRGMQLYSCLDSRPQNRWHLVEIAQRTLFAAKLSRDTLAAAMASGSSQNFDGRLIAAIAKRDPRTLFSLFNSSNRTFEKLEVVHVLSRMPSVPAFELKVLYSTLATKNPNRWDSADGYYRFLCEQKQYAQAQAFVEQWIRAQNNKFTFVDEALARTALAQALHAQGQYAKALTALGKSCNTELYAPLAEKSLLLAALGRNGEAITWATEAVKRQPNQDDSYVLLAEMFWKTKNYNEAAQALMRGQRVLSRVTWQDKIGPVFAHIFSNDKAGSEKALQALKQAGFAHIDCVGELAHAAYLADKAELAFETLSTVEASQNQLSDMLVCGYRYLKRWKGQPAALAWLKAQVPEDSRHTFAPYAFVSGQYELLWSFSKDPADTSEQESLWLIQSAAGLLDKKNSAATLAEIKKKVQARSGAVAALICEVLSSGEISQKSVLSSMILSPEQLCQSGFFLGWRGLACGTDFYESTDWMRLSMMTERANQLEYQWSHRWLSDMLATLRRIPALTESGTAANIRVVAPTGADWKSERRFKLVLQ